jgi:hypothetical protein
VKVGVAKTGGDGAHQHLSRPHDVDVHIADDELARRGFEDGCAHSGTIPLEHGDPVGTARTRSG